MSVKSYLTYVNYNAPECVSVCVCVCACVCLCAHVYMCASESECSQSMLLAPRIAFPLLTGEVSPECLEFHTV